MPCHASEMKPTADPVDPADPVFPEDPLTPYQNGRRGKSKIKLITV